MEMNAVQKVKTAVFAAIPIIEPNENLMEKHRGNLPRCFSVLRFVV